MLHDWSYAAGHRRPIPNTYHLFYRWVTVATMINLAAPSAPCSCFVSFRRDEGSVVDAKPQ
jgi:hypothetical protein